MNKPKETVRYKALVNLSLPHETRRVTWWAGEWIDPSAYTPDELEEKIRRGVLERVVIPPEPVAAKPATPASPQEGM